MATFGTSTLQQEYRVCVLELPAGDDPTDGDVSALALIVLRRMSGMLLCVPKGFFTDEILAAGLAASAEDQVGQSIEVTVPAGHLDNFEDPLQPSQVVGEELQVVLVDVTLDMEDHLSPFNAAAHPLELVHTFDSDHQSWVPMTEELVAAAWAWVSDPGSGERAAFYSATEEEQVPMTPKASPSLGRVPKAGSGILGGSPPARKEVPKKPRPTVASLSTSLEGISATLPQLVQELKDLSSRTARMEMQLETGESRTSALRQPLGRLGTLGSTPTAPGLQGLVKEMPPPRSSLKTPLKGAATTSLFQQDAEELAEEQNQEDNSSSLTRAVLMQSQALSSLVSQLAGGESMVEPSGSSISLSNKGAQGRLKLQQELSMHKGVFFNSVYSAMARRMQPARPSNCPPAELALRGVTATQYTERYGGYGRCRDIGNIMWQVSLIMDFLQSENTAAAKDGIALLAVCLEQTAIDGGRMDVAQVLALTEDPPAGVFSMRSLPSSSRSRVFSPLADQRWITNALSYLKELDAIATRRADYVTPKKEGSEDKSGQPNPKKAGRKAKATWKKRQDQEEEAE